MRSLEIDQIKAIIDQIRNPDSEKAQRLYKVLLEEKENYKAVEKEYIVDTAEIMDRLKNEITAIKTHYLHQKRQESEAQSKHIEMGTAEDILKLIK